MPVQKTQHSVLVSIPSELSTMILTRYPPQLFFRHCTTLTEPECLQETLPESSWRDTSQLHRANRDAFLIVPLSDMAAFAICLGLAIVWRTNPERHRRLMLIATCALTGAAFGRMPIMHAPLYFYGGIDGLILLGVLRDLAVSRRIHTVYLIAIPLLVAGQTAVAQVFLHRSTFWIRIAHRLMG